MDLPRSLLKGSWNWRSRTGRCRLIKARLWLSKYAAVLLSRSEVWLSIRKLQLLCRTLEEKLRGCFVLAICWVVCSMETILEVVA